MVFLAELARVRDARFASTAIRRSVFSECKGKDKGGGTGPSNPEGPAGPWDPIGGIGH